MEHRPGEIEQKQTESPPGRCERGKENENADRNRANHPEEACQYVSLVDMSQTGNETKQHGDGVACFAFCGLRRAADPIASAAAFRVLRQEMPAVRARHFIARARFDRSRRGICVLDLHNYRQSQAARNSSSKEKFRRGKPRITQITRIEL